MRSYVPNALSVSRIATALLLVLLSERLTVVTYISTVSLLTFAMLTDALDGYLARRWKVTSSLGYVLDTMGDRAVHLAMVLMFFERYGLHPVLIWLLVFRGYRDIQSVLGQGLVARVQSRTTNFSLSHHVLANMAGADS